MFEPRINLWKETSKELKLEVALAFVVVLIPGIFTIVPPTNEDNGILLQLYQARFFMLVAWVSFAVGGAISTLALAKSRDRPKWTATGTTSPSEDSQNQPASSNLAESDNRP